MPTPTATPGRAWRALYGLLVRCLPRSFRDDFGDEALADFEALLRDAREDGLGQMHTTAIAAVADVALRVVIERIGALFRASPHDTERAPAPGWGERMWNGMREVRVAARALTRRPGFTAVAVVTLGLGIGANTAIYSVVDSVLLRPLPYDESDRIVMVQHHAPAIELPTLTVSAGLMNYYWESADFFEPLASYSRSRVNLTGSEQPAQIDALMATPELFEVLRVRPAMGRTLQAADISEGAAPVAILTDRGWKTRFGGDPDILGRTVALDGVVTEIVGIMSPDFSFSEPFPTLLTPLSIDPLGDFGEFGTIGIARLAPGVSIDQAGARLAELQTRLVERFPELTQDFLDQAGWSASVTAWRDVLVADIESTLWIVLGTVGLVLLIACANVANLFLVRAEDRQKEMAIRSAMGASRASVAGSYLAESVLLGAAGGVLGTAVAWFGLRVLIATGPAQLPRLNEIGLSPGAMALALLLGLAGGVGFGSLPLLRSARTRLAATLRDGGRANTGGVARHRTRNVLVATQLALALVLLVGSGLMFRSFLALHSVQPGFDPDGVLVVGLSHGESGERIDRARFYQAVADQVAALPGVETVGITTRVPLSTGNTNGGSFSVESQPREETELPPVAMYRAIGPGYFESMDIAVLEGRSMVRADWEGGPGVVWVTQAFAERYLGGKALGERLRWDDDSEFAEIVGVVADTKEMELSEDAEPWAYLPLMVADWSYPGLEAASLTVEVASGQDVLGLVPSIRSIVSRLDPDVPLTTSREMSAVINDSMASTSFAMVMLGIATGVAVFLGAIGLFGVISYVVSQRTREIGVRVALGAASGAVSGMVVRQALSVTLVGAGLGLIGAFGLTRLMAALLYGVSATDPLTFVAAPVLLIVVSLLATWLPARRASRVDPMEALRAE